MREWKRTSARGEERSCLSLPLAENNGQRLEAYPKPTRDAVHVVVPSGEFAAVVAEDPEGRRNLRGSSDVEQQRIATDLRPLDGEQVGGGEACADGGCAGTMLMLPLRAGKGNERDPAELCGVRSLEAEG